MEAKNTSELPLECIDPKVIYEKINKFYETYENHIDYRWYISLFRPEKDNPNGEIYMFKNEDWDIIIRISDRVKRTDNHETILTINKEFWKILLPRIIFMVNWQQELYHKIDELLNNFESKNSKIKKQTKNTQAEIKKELE